MWADIHKQCRRVQHTDVNIECGRATKVAAVDEITVPHHLGVNPNAIIDIGSVSTCSGEGRDRGRLLARRVTHRHTSHLQTVE